eukprot:8670217-Alexandrium_andersonii.AAC.1
MSSLPHRCPWCPIDRSPPGPNWQWPEATVGLAHRGSRPTRPRRAIRFPLAGYHRPRRLET